MLRFRSGTMYRRSGKSETVAYFEIDFLSVGESQSGDAIALRYERQGNTFVHVVDGGFQDDGPHIMAHLRKYYGGKGVSHVVLTHPDNDHAGGLGTVLEECAVPPGGGLWMLRPWLYASELIDHFARFTTVSGLEMALREAYPNVVALEAIAQRRGIPHLRAFPRCNDRRVHGPRAVEGAVSPTDRGLGRGHRKEAAPAGSMGLLEALQSAAAKVARYAKAAWGVEVFSTEPTSAENEMSVVQYASLCDEKILITGDVGREGLTEAADFAPLIGLQLPGIDRFDVPHHGSRRNVSTELLDRVAGSSPHATVARRPRLVPRANQRQPGRQGTPAASGGAWPSTSRCECGADDREARSVPANLQERPIQG